MSVTLKERRERAEGRIESLLGNMDEMVRQVYESLLERGADYKELNEKQEVARLEGFHDYIVVREETGVDHPSLEEYIEVKKRLGDELLSFGTGKHRKPIEGEGEAPELADEEPAPVFWDDDKSSSEDTPPVVVVSRPGSGGQRNTSAPEVTADEPETVEVEAVRPSGRRAAQLPVDGNGSAEVEAPVEENKVARSIFDDDDDVVISSDVADDSEGDGSAPAFDDLISADKDERKEEKRFIAQASVETEEDVDTITRITPSDIVDKEFSFKMGGLDQDEVDDLLDEVAQFMTSPHDSSVWLEQAKAISKKEFTKKGGFKKGYVPAEVKEFMDALNVELEIRASEA